MPTEGMMPEDTMDAHDSDLKPCCRARVVSELTETKVWIMSV